MTDTEDKKRWDTGERRYYLALVTDQEEATRRPNGEVIRRWHTGRIDRRHQLTQEEAEAFKQKHPEELSSHENS